MKHRVYVVLFCLLALLFLPQRMDADELPQEILSGDIFWSKQNSPYIISDHFIVPAGSKLHINPGTVIKFNGGKLTVYGKLISYGTEQDKVKITHIADTYDEENVEQINSAIELPFDTGPQIEIESSDTAEIYNTDISNAYSIHFKNTNARIENATYQHSKNYIEFENSNVDLHKIKIEGIQLGGLVFSEKSTFSAADIMLTDIYKGDAIDIYSEAGGDLNNIKIKNIKDGTGINIFDSASTTVKNLYAESIINSNAIGIHDSHVSIANGNIQNVPVGSGIASYDSKIYMDEISISKIGRNAALVSYDSNLSLKNSYIKEGKDYGIEFYGNRNHGSLDIDNIVIENFEGGGLLAYNAQGEITESKVINSRGGIELYNSPILISQSIIKENTDFGLKVSGTDAVDARNNWWGDATGPLHVLENTKGKGNKIIGSAFFSPWLEFDPEKPQGFSSVLFIPGFQASRLYTEGTFFENQLWEPNRKNDVEKLYLSSEGESNESGIYTRDVIKETNILPEILFGQNIYKTFLQSLDTLKENNDIKEWKVFPYDWRLSIETILERGKVDAEGNLSFENPLQSNEKSYIISLLEDLQKKSLNGKVTIIAHSNGGLLAKALMIMLQEMKDRGESDLIDTIDNLILVAVPQSGSPKAISSLLHGDDQELPKKIGILIDKPIARKLGSNMKSAYGLLPTEEYFQTIPGKVVSFSDDLLNSSLLTRIDEKEIDSFSKLKNYLIGENGIRSNPEFSDTDRPLILSEEMLTSVELYNKKIAAWVTPSTLKVYQVAGWGIDTLMNIHYSKDSITECSTEVLYVCTDKEILKRDTYKDKEGDGTVPLTSAALLNRNTIYVDLFAHNLELIGGLRRNRSHADILEVAPLQRTIGEIITGKEITYTEIIKSSKPQQSSTSKTLRIGIFSPLTIGITNEKGEHTGRITSTSTDLVLIKEEIPNSSYDEYGHGKFVEVNTGEKYTVELNGYDYGTFDIEIMTSENDVIKRTYIEDIPVSPRMNGKIDVEENGVIKNITIDVNGDGIIDENINPEKGITVLEKLTLFRKIIDSLSIKKSARRIIENKINEIENLIRKGKLEKIEKRINTFLRRFDYGKGQIKALDDDMKKMLNQNFNEYI